MADWIKAFRLRTLPLAFACIIVGCSAAYSSGCFDQLTVVLLLTTTLFLQVLSNLANDYGDFVKGTDNENRVGPERALQSGRISKSQMVVAIIILAVLSGLSGSALIYVGTMGLPLIYIGGFLLLGVLAVVAAIRYSVGRRAYGYVGMGDAAVFLFFGLAGVLGSCFLLAHSLDWMLLLPASAIGLLSAAVLNINNMRDHVEDEKSGKRTLVVVMGLRRAKLYHLLLNVSAVSAMVLYAGTVFGGGVMLLSGAVLFWLPAMQIMRAEDHEAFDPFLKRQALGTFVYAVVFAFVL
jgi:1,4-dihydroxy-2-naphthoate octaprenyltransferase